tara:strand:+ start:1259 stop:2452 length:1194 start_codon:yes stop_codon:yes gene_type:complete
MTSTKGPLQNYRIIDFTDRHGVLGTRILAGLGAEVIRIEPPGGDPMRQYGPLSGDGNSFFWLQMNAAKKSVVLDLKSESGRTLLWSLLKSSDALFESGFRNDLELHGFDWGNLSAKCPELVYTTISPFGCEGPRSHWVGGDLVAMAAGGLMYLCGDQDRAPLRVSVEQASAQSSVQAMVGTLIALRACKKGAFGQRVDISMQEAITNTLGNSQATYALTKVISKRAGGGRASGEGGARLVWPCADGYVAFSRSPRAIPLIHQWMIDEGVKPKFDPEPIPELTGVGSAPSPELNPTAAKLIQEIDQDIEAFFKRFSKMELYEEGQRRGTMMCPVSTIANLFENKQLIDRQFFVDVEHPESGHSYTYPGAPFRMSKSIWQSGPSAPVVGQHSEEILRSL